MACAPAARASFAAAFAAALGWSIVIVPKSAGKVLFRSFWVGQPDDSDRDRADLDEGEWHRDVRADLGLDPHHVRRDVGIGRGVDQVLEVGDALVEIVIGQDVDLRIQEAERLHGGHVGESGGQGR